MVSIENPSGRAEARAGVLSLEDRLPRPEITLPLIVGLFLGLLKILHSLPHPWVSGAAKPDDMARLAQARDLLNGQGWFDLLQTRLDPPDGVWMHWSRLVDAPIAGLLWLGEATGAGEALALFVWPLLLMLAFFVVIARVACALFGPRGTFFAVFVTMFFESTLQAFAPGRIDHHNVQILLSAVLLLALMRLADGARAGVAAGLAAALMIGVGIESLPLVAAGAAMAVGLWLWNADRYAAGTRAFGASFALSTAVVFLVSVPGARYALAQCDSISLAHLVSAVLGGVGIALIVRLVPSRSPAWTRAGALGLLGVVCGGVAATFFSHCLGDPMDFLDPRLREIWLDNVSEAQSAITALRQDPAKALIHILPMAVFAMVFGVAMRTAPREARANWVLLALFAAVAVAVCLAQVRFFQFAHLFCIPAAAWLMSTVHRAILERGVSPRRVIMLAAVPIVTSPWLGVLPKMAFMPADPAAATAAAIARDHGAIEDAAVRECQSSADRAALAALAPGIVAAPIFFGSTVLGLSTLPVLSGPYHRAQRAILDTYAIFSGPPPESLGILRRRGIDYVVICLSSANRLVDGDRYPDSLTAALERGAPPDWLERVPGGSGSFLRIYRLRRSAG